MEFFPAGRGIAFFIKKRYLGRKNLEKR